MPNRTFPNPTQMLAPQEENNFLELYFASIYNKLEADALLFNRQLPHAGLVGAENENAIAEVLRDFLPAKYGIEVNALVIDRFGRKSRQADIVIYDAERQARFFRKVYPVEIVYAVIEVKTCLSSPEARSALDNLASVSQLEFRPALSNDWVTRTPLEDIHHDPPALYLFSYRTACNAFETFARWIDWDYLQRGTPLREKAPTRPEVRLIRACALDKGVIHMESTNGNVQRLVTVADDPTSPRAFNASLNSESVRVDPAKALFIFMHRLWEDLQDHRFHPGFDIRTYMSTAQGQVIQVGNELVYQEETPNER
jgi:hypothetical protein